MKSSPAIALLAAAAPHAISNERLGVLFDVDTMKPRITEPAFVDALTQLPLSSKESPSKDSLTSEPQVPVLGYNDRLLAVTASSRNAASAFKLAEWLALAETGSQFARVSGDWLPPRRSVASSSSWYEPTLSAGERSKRSTQVDAALSGERALVVPRIPGIDAYLAALDTAVKSALDGKSSPAAALQTATDEWEKITDRLGRDKQRDAYQKHLGISDE
jgi:ABC-type glycerol-3-phosphate transport system substrate-binding protein